jgi:plasmid stabilization system protein ParE
MSYRVAFAATAAADVARSYNWLAERSATAAERWRQSLLEAVESLTDFPERFPLAPENDWYPVELRQLLHGKRGNVYRVLFITRGQVVYILRVRHGAQDLLRPGDLPIEDQD